MAGEWTMEKVQDTLVEVVQRAARDEAFRKKALKDPDGAIHEVAGMPPKERGKVAFTEDESSAVRDGDRVVLPLTPAGKSVSQDEAVSALSGRRESESSSSSWWPWSWPWTSFTATCKEHPCK